MPMSWEQLLNAERLGSSPRHAEQARSPFHKDHDRIIFSAAFRRLNRKTQVHPFAQNDHVHTRLTHSLEVACVGRTLGQLVGEYLGDQLPCGISSSDIGAIIQSACLAHDIGNPPFGHAGEFAIRDWFLQPARQQLLSQMTSEQAHDLCNFEGNAQGLRLLAQTEHHPFQGGMRLTYATLGAFIKYPWTGHGVPLTAAMPKFGCYQAEAEVLATIAHHLGLLPQGNLRWCRHPLAYLMEAADDICYALIDLEDGIEMDILPYEQVEPLFLNLLGNQAPPPELQVSSSTTAHKIAALRGAAFNVLVQAVAQAFMQSQEALLNGTLQGSLLDHCDRHLGAGIEAAKAMARHRIFNNPRKAQIELGAYATLGLLLDAFIEASLAGLNNDSLSFRHRRLLDLLQSQVVQPADSAYSSCLRALDFVGSLSDHHAMDLARSLAGHVHNLP